jgi:hypothetical protein
MDIQSILRQAVADNASDVFIVAGLPISIRKNGEVIQDENEKLLPEVTESLVLEIYRLAGRDLDHLNRIGDDDFSFALRGISRFRVSAYKQRGSYSAVIRVITFELPNPDERFIEVVSDVWENDPAQLKDGRLRLPPNMWFIGTANNDDSTFAISDKVYDRAMILNLDAKSERFAAPKTRKTIISSEQFVALVDQAIKEYGVSKRNKQRLEKLDKYLIDHFHITFGNRIMKQINTYIPVYVACGGDELDALDDILAKKVIRKLETQNPIYLRNTAEGLVAYIDELFGVENMTLCKEHIHRLQRNA